MDHARAQEENARILLDCVPVGIVVVDAQGNIKLVNASTEKLFGYKRFELLDRSIEVQVPVRLGDMHKAERKTFLQKPEARPMGAGRDLTARRRDGSEFPVEIGLNLVSHDGSSAVMATVIDISERKRAQQGQHARAATGTTSTSPAGS
jgi:PAS domain S-box-containing protein